jgi:hypothetical protein
MHAMNEGAAYFIIAVSYVCKMFMKSTTGGDVINLFLSLPMSLG